MPSNWKPLEWRDGKVRLLDQTRLPREVVYCELGDWREVAEAISTMIVRGAPAIGCTAALGMALGARQIQAGSPREFQTQLEEIAAVFRATRPTAVNLFWAIERMLKAAQRALREAPASTFNAQLVAGELRREAQQIVADDVAINRRLGTHGAQLLPQNGRVLTHCNAGALATAGYGTALGVVRAACEAGKQIHVFADETRPRWQGLKLTVWELQQDNIPVTAIADSMAAVLMREGKIDCIVVGADRIAANGDTANKIGTYNVAVAAQFHGVPFYVAAPLSTIDFDLPDGAQIPIEERAATEMTHVESTCIAPSDVEVWNPAFDVTPAALISAIITETGIARPPFETSLAVLRATQSR